MTLQQPTQQVFDGVVVGFAMLVHGIREQRRTYDTIKEMEEGNKRLQATAFHQGWDMPVPTEYRVRFKTDSGEEEDVDQYQYYVPHLKNRWCKIGSFKPLKQTRIRFREAWDME